MTKSILSVLFAYIFLIALVLAYLLSGHAADEANFDKLTLGMTQAEVRSLIGEPSYGRMVDEGEGNDYDHQHWRYQSKWPFKWCGMDIFFSPEGTVSSWFHDH